MSFPSNRVLVRAPVRVFLSGPAFHIRPQNTDWQYLRLLTRLPEFTDGLSIHRERASWRTVAFNLRYAAGIAVNRLQLPIGKDLAPNSESRLDARDLDRSKSEVIYAYGACPVNAGRVPVIFHTGALHREVLQRARLTPKQIDARVKKVGELASRAVLLTANSQAALDNLAEVMPKVVPRMRVLPFFLPHLEAVSEEAIAAKFRESSRTRMLFVGREARRKGLPEVLAAFKSLDAKMPGQLELTVVSSLSDGGVELPLMSNLKHIPELDQSGVQTLMRNSHLLLMPSHYESFGWVYLEAMAAGTIPVASDAPIQREILANGRAGILTSPDEGKIEAAIEPLLRDRRALEQSALEAARWCRANYLPRAVAERMREVFCEARELGK